jgi:hypothetical protein
LAWSPANSGNLILSPGSETFQYQCFTYFYRIFGHGRQSGIGECAVVTPAVDTSARLIRAIINIFFSIISAPFVNSSSSKLRLDYRAFGHGRQSGIGEWAVVTCEVEAIPRAIRATSISFLSM